MMAMTGWPKTRRDLEGVALAEADGRDDAVDAMLITVPDAVEDNVCSMRVWVAIGVGKVEDDLVATAGAEVNAEADDDGQARVEAEDIAGGVTVSVERDD